MTASTHRRYHSISSYELSSDLGHPSAPPSLSSFPPSVQLRKPSVVAKRYTVARKSTLSVSINPLNESTSSNGSTIDEDEVPKTAPILIKDKDNEASPTKSMNSGRFSPPKSPNLNRNNGQRALGLKAAVGSYRERQASVGKPDIVSSSFGYFSMPQPYPAAKSVPQFTSHRRRATVSNVLSLPTNTVGNNGPIAATPPTLDQLIKWKLKKDEKEKEIGKDSGGARVMKRLNSVPTSSSPDTSTPTTSSPSPTTEKTPTQASIRSSSISLVRNAIEKKTSTYPLSPIINNSTGSNIANRIACGKQMLNALEKRKRISSIQLIA